MSGIALITKGMICQGIANNTMNGTYGRPFQESVIEAPIINVTKIRTKVIKKGIDLTEMSNISIKIDDVLSSQ